MNTIFGFREIMEAVASLTAVTIIAAISSIHFVA